MQLLFRIFTILLIGLTSACSTVTAGKSDVCEQKTNIKYQELFKLGAKKDEVIAKLKAENVSYQVWGKDEMKNFMDPDEDIYTSKILIHHEFPSSKLSLVTFSENLILGFNDEDTVEHIVCEKFGTGP